MATPTLAFFSSDASELYKADVYRVLALPTGYVVHFRYRKDLVDGDVLADPRKTINSSGIIFYVSGNDLAIDEDARQLSVESIRRVTVQDCATDDKINHIRFYLRLEGFVHATIDTEAKPGIRPPKLFVAKLAVDEHTDHTWIHRVDAVRAGFGQRPFFSIGDLKRGRKGIRPVYSPDSRAAYYPLEDETDYHVAITLYDPSLGPTGLVVENEIPEVILAVAKGHRIGARADTQEILLQTHTLPRAGVWTSSRIEVATYPQEDAARPSGDYRVHLDWRVTKRKARIWQFGLLSCFATFGLGLAKLATDDLTKVSFCTRNVVVGVAGLVLIGLSAAMLFALHNKK